MSTLHTCVYCFKEQVANKQRDGTCYSDKCKNLICMECMEECMEEEEELIRNSSNFYITNDNDMFYCSVSCTYDGEIDSNLNGISDTYEKCIILNRYENEMKLVINTQDKNIRFYFEKKVGVILNEYFIKDLSKIIVEFVCDLN